MSTSTVERTGDWDSVPFTGGFAGLRDLADEDFSGMVTAGPARLFMLRGSVIGVLDGDIEDFADGGGTAREAPHPALPLLAVMQERSDEVRAQYYTEETPLSEVDRTLADGNFTGFVELSENVLSGDYYQVYHQGRSMSVAYVGASERLIVDDEAFEQADDEVGIYKVRPVDVEIIDIPEPSDDGGSGGAAATTGGADAGTGTDAVDDVGASVDEPRSDAADDEPSDDDSTDEDPSDAVPSDAETAVDSGGDVTTGASGSGSSETTVDDPAVDDAVAGDDADVERSAATDDEPAATNTTSAAAEDDRNVTADRNAATEPNAETDRAVEPDVGMDDEAVESAMTDAQHAESHDAGRESAQSESDSAASAGAGATSDGTQASSGSDATSEVPSDASTEGTADAAAGQSGAAGSNPTAKGAGGQQRGQANPEHPAAAGQGGQSAGNASNGGVSSTPDRPEGPVSAGDLEVRSLPSLDPSRTASASKQERDRRSASAGGTATSTSQPQHGRQDESATPPAQGRQTGGSPPDTGDPEPQPQERGGSASTERPATDATVAADESSTDAEEPAESAETAVTDADETGPAPTESGDGPATDEDGTASGDLEDARAEVERLKSELADLRGEHGAVVEERDRLQAELAEAREEIDRLQGRLEDAAGLATEANRKLTPREAIDETNLFIRYDSKGEATLEKAHAGQVDNDAVDANMRLEYHTSFDAEDAAVDGIDFDTFLTDTVQYRFVDWLVRKLLYEIRDTDNTSTMGELYDALPKVDRAELNGQVGVQYTEDGQEQRTQVGFDVIVRDRMGNPLIVANLNDSRDPATDSMMTDLVRAAERVGESSSSLAGAFLVTRSFFEPGALETAEEATAGGLLNRGKQKSFVNLSRKGGYHLCLVEARNQEFHLAVPEL